MASSFNKDILRSIRGSLGRFIALAAIVALGTGFYAGLRMTCPNMNLAADEYFDGTALMDVRVVSTMGMTAADMDALRAVEGVEQVMPAYETDVIAIVNDEQCTVRMHSLPEGAAQSRQVDRSTIASDDSAYLNRLVLAEGRWPEKPGECVISADGVMDSPTKLGDTLEVTEGASDLDDVIATRLYTIVGYVHAPYYATSVSMGSTSIGSGSIEQFMYVLEDDFAQDYPFTEAFITVAGAKDLMSGTDEYEVHVGETLDRIGAIAQEREQARYDELHGEAQDKLDDARAEYAEEKADALAQLADAKAELDGAWETLNQTGHDLDAAQQQVDAGLQELADAERQLAAAWEQAGLTAEGAPAAMAQLEHAIAWLSQDSSQAQKVQELQAQLAALQALADNQAAFDAARPAAEAQLAASQAQIDEARAQVSAGWAEYHEGLSAYEDARAEADDAFVEAEQEIADAQAQIDDIAYPEWLVMDRTKNPGVVSFASDAERIDNIASVFPFIFFLVAALVALTTMTRMVEEERVLIGTYKALGYSRARITSKYLIYAGVASVVGSIIGIVALSLALPLTIMKAYAIIYYVPHGIPVIDIPLALLAAGLGIGITLVATWAAATATLREQPARLMLPRAPKAGKRILLEHVTPLWSRLGFSWKVTFRNLFRYKKRFIMTVIGIAGCTALLLTGLGLQNSINDIVDKHFGPIVHYNVSVTVEDDLTDEAQGQLDAVLGDPGVVESSTRTYEKPVVVVAQGAGAKDMNVPLVVPQDTGAFQDMWTMRERTGQAPLTLGDDGVIITEKLGYMYGVGVGDTITVAAQDNMGNATDETYDLLVTGITENYVYNHVFASPAYFAKMFGETPAYTTTYAVMSTDEQVRAAFTDEVRAIDGVRTIVYNDETIDTYRTMLRSVNMVVVVLVVAAAALAFIVLYNLTNINITERVREIATLKVLGFNAREVCQYIYRETMLLTVIGCLVGLVFGVYLEGFVITTAEVDAVMFGRDIHASSFVIAFALTLAFAAFVMWVMRKKLARIDMVESLKSNE